MKRFLLFVFALAWVAGASAQKTITPEGADETVRLWDNTTAKYSNYETRDEAWNNKRHTSIKQTSSCELYIFHADPAKNRGVAIAIFPGGSYVHLSFHSSLARWYASIGVTVALVKYRLPNGGHWEAMLEDAAGAVRYLRTRTDLGIDPMRVGVGGSSAGGHLASWVSNAMEDGEKPAFAILHYGAMLRTQFYTTLKGNNALLGKGFTYQQAEDLTITNMVSETTPPTLMLLCDDDNMVRSYSSTTYYATLLRYGVKASIHIYPNGGHSLTKHTKEYRAAIVDWLDWLGFVKQ